ncbi:hypothetical protein MNBD_GAMMA06-1886 [hydrothermal vent metagenome]|uniref:Rhodanese domain-containing protein n=1 Tax=hydrothermal vent metagenome TaxID=652676 RepID=A0A3B0X5S9_9ZZZZ
MQSVISNNKFMMLFSLIGFITIWVVANPIEPSTPIVNHISPIEASALIQSKNTLVLDVREEEAFNKGHLPNAVSVPIGELNKRLDELYALDAQEVIVYCNDGSTRGPRATKMLNDAGYPNAKNLKGGAEEWTKANLNLVTQ